MNVQSLPAEYSKLQEQLSRADESTLKQLEDETARFRIKVQEEVRRRWAKANPIVPGFQSLRGEPLKRHIAEKDAPWRALPVAQVDIPGMITQEEKQYYLYIAEFYTGAGEAIELGP